MATGYKALMALGESHTKSLESTVQAALAQKKQKELQRRKQQEQQEQRQRELDNKLRLRYFEEQKKKAEVEAKKAEAQKAQEADLLRREAAQRDALRYGPKKAKTVAGNNGKWPTSDSGVREEVRRKRLPDDDDEGETGVVLTREEKRERKMQAELKKAFHAPRRTGHVTGTRRAGRRLPGGAYDMQTTPADAVAAASGSGNVKDRLSAMPNTLTRLNVNKRDTRTIDEIVRDRRENKAEVLDGDRARTFDDWFTPSSRAQPSPKNKPSVSPSPGDEGTFSTRVQPKKEKAPIPSSSYSSSSSRTSSQTNPVNGVRSIVAVGILRPTAQAPLPRPKPKAPLPAQASSSKKRPRSLSASRSVSPPPKRAHLATGSSKSVSSSAKAKSTSSRSRSPAAASFSDEIWGIFGKNRSKYVGRDVESDSEDDDVMMEAGADALELEEKISQRIARKEDREAEMEERRREEEKRRRKAAMASR
ncbi:hypothetical protein DFH06DRAFT_1175593 [Mycena polygramma]|nr:hypothetical protein DFH06DRAFT_1175593 [Mycena polygramma]